MPSSYRRAAAFAPKDRASALGRVSDEEPHPWVTCLDVDRNTVLAQFFRCGRSNRGDGRRLETLTNRSFEIVLPGDLEEMNDLRRRRKQSDLNLPVRHSSCGMLQWPGVVRERVPVHRHTGHRSSPLGKPIKELRIRGAVLLERDTSDLQPALGT